MTELDLPGLAARLEACADYPKQYTTEAVVDCETLREAAQALRATSAPHRMMTWVKLSDDTSWLDGRDVVLLARGMEVTARYCAGEWSDDTPVSPREYSGAVWSCFDDEFQLEIEECSKDPKEWGHDGATHWRMPLRTAPQSFTSGHIAGQREALEHVRDYLIPRAKFINGNPDKKNAEHVLLDQVEEALGDSHD